MRLDLDKMPITAILKKDKINSVLQLAEKLDYYVIKVDYNTGLLRFHSVTTRTTINLYCTTFTVTTEIFHPKKGKTQLHRKKLSLEKVLKVFVNPRLHTGKGYYKK